MLEIDEPILQAINSAIDKFQSLAEKEQDMRLLSGALGKIGNKMRAMAEIRDTPDNRFVSFLVQYLISDVNSRFEAQDDKWFELHKENADQILGQLKIFVNSLKSSLVSGSSESAIDAIKMFFFAYWHMVLDFGL